MEAKFVYFRLLLVLLFGMALSASEGYKSPYYMDEHASSSVSKNTIQLTSQTRAVVIKASARQSYRPVQMTATCYIKAPKDYKLAVSVVFFNIPKDGGECRDYLEIEGLAHHSDDEEMCGSKEELASAYYTPERNGHELKITFKTVKRTTQQLWSSPNFEIVVTALRKQQNCSPPSRFQCNNYLCVPSIYLCDGVNNCGDLSDENKCKNGQLGNEDEAQGMSPFFLVILIFAGIVLTTLLISVAIYKCRKGKNPGRFNEMSRIATVSGVERQLSSSQSCTTPRPNSPLVVTVDNQPYNPYYGDNPVFQPYQGGYGSIPEATVPPPSYEEATLRK